MEYGIRVCAMSRLLFPKGGAATPLMMVAQQGDVKMLKILLSSNANINVKNQVIVFCRICSYEFGPGDNVDCAFIQPQSQRSKPLTDGV